MKHIFVSNKEINFRKAKLLSELISELCEMVDLARVGRVSVGAVANHWRALRKNYDLSEFFTIFEEELDNTFPTAMTPDCIEY